MTTLTRIIFSFIAIAMASLASAIYSPWATLAAGKAAGGQMLPSDAVYLGSTYTMSFLSGINTAIWLPTLFVIALIWARPIKDVFVAMWQDDSGSR